MNRDHNRVWLLRPGFTVEQFGQIPSWLDETDERRAAEQLGERWQPIEGQWRMVLLKEKELMYPALRIGGEDHRVLGAIHLCHDLLVLCEGDLIAIVKSEPSSGASPLMNGVWDVGRIAFAEHDAEAFDALPATGG